MINKISLLLTNYNPIAMGRHTLHFALICCLINISAFSQTPGSLDTSFNSGDIGYGYGSGPGGNVIALQPDGKIIAASSQISRLLMNGENDTTFISSNAHAHCVTVHPNGNIFVGGDFTNHSGVSRNNILSLDSFGNLDTTFFPGTGFNKRVFALAIQSDGKILAGGEFGAYNGDSAKGVIRLNMDGTRDTSFITNLGTGAAWVNAIKIQTDGKIIIGGNFTSYNGVNAGCIARLNTDGSLDSTFNTGSGIGIYPYSAIYTLALQPNGKIIAGGFFRFFDSLLLPVHSIIRINTDGSRDTTFGKYGFWGGSSTDEVLTIDLQQDGKIIVGGGFDKCDSVIANSLARLDTNGVLDTTFITGLGFNQPVKGLIVQPDGQILLSGQFSYYNNFGRNNIIRLGVNGIVDTTFLKSSGFNNTASEVVLQPDGKILTMGWFTSYNNIPYFSITRLFADGNPDTSFHQNNTRIMQMKGNLFVQPNGQILASGFVNMPLFHGIIRLNQDGSIDSSFLAYLNGMTKFFPSAFQPDGKIIIGMGAKYCNRLNNDGSTDSTFFYNEGTGFDDYINSIALQNDGKIVVAGEFDLFDGHACGKIARMNSDGTYDSTFNTGIGFDFLGAEVLTIQPDGKILVGGDFDKFNGINQKGLVRLNTDGSKDTTFIVGGGISEKVFSIILQPDGKIIVGGVFSTYNSHSSKNIVRLNSNGSYDATFVVGSGFDQKVCGQVLQPDGKLIVVGEFGSYNGIGRNRIARLHAYTPSTTITTEGIDASTFILSPNPTTSSITLSNFNPAHSYSISIKNILGNTIISQTTKGKERASINVEQLPSGIYFVMAESDGVSVVKKFVKK